MDTAEPRPPRRQIADNRAPVSVLSEDALFPGWGPRL